MRPTASRQRTYTEIVAIFAPRSIYIYICAYIPDVLYQNRLSARLPPHQNTYTQNGHISEENYGKPMGKSNIFIAYSVVAHVAPFAVTASAFDNDDI